MNFFQGWWSVVTSFAQPVLDLVRARWLRTFVYACAVALVLWFYGSYIRIGTWVPLDSDEHRLYAVGACFAAWLLFLLWWLVAGRKRNDRLIAGLSGGIDPGAATAMEVEQMRQRLQHSLQQLRRLTKGRRGYLYELPWYVLIGPPGSGKTTSLRNSGLKFPMARGRRDGDGLDGDGRDPVRGVGGTRNCDWWITEQAILLDTAGRYTTQDSDPDADRGAWQGFLKLLKQYRPLQPVNGVVVAIGIDEILSGSTADRVGHGDAVRARIHELNAAFDARLPIYVLFTKADLVAGFVEFFDGLNRPDREQVWGMTFPLDENQAGEGRADTASASARFETEFDLLLGRLNSLMLERLQQEVDIERRGLVFGFPSQIAALKEPVREFLEEAFSTTRFDQRPLLRGVYLSSGTQTGAPVDRLMQSMATSFGMAAPRRPAFAGAAKTYFLTRLLEGVVFAEASLAAVSTRVARRRRAVRLAAATVGLLVVAGMGGLWFYSFRENERMVAELDRHVAEYATAAAGLDTGPVGDDDYASVAPALNKLASGYAILDRPDLPPLRALGLNQSDKLRGQYTDTYVRALDRFLLPRVLVTVGKQLRAGSDDADRQFEALKIYLSLGNQGPLDEAAVRGWMHAAWEVAYPADAELRAALDRHLAAMLAHPLPTVTLDGALIASVRRNATARPLAQRTYALIRDGREAAALPDWRPLDKTGALGTRVFFRQSGKPLTEGIPGFYTRRGYFEVLLPQMSRAIEQARKESWVYGAPPSAAGGGPGAAPPAESNGALATQIAALYRNDFDTRWRTLLGDVRVSRFGNLDGAIQVLNALSGPQSTLRKLLAAVADDTDLSPPPADTKDEGQLAALRVIRQFGLEGPDSFAGLREAVRSANGEVGETVRLLDALYNAVSRISDASTAATPVASAAETGVTEAVGNLVSGARRMPAPSDTWMLSLTGNVTAVTSGTARAKIGAMWSGGGARFCQQAIADRYPFNPGARADISLDDFDKLFAPGGVFDRFFEANLKPYVNQSSSPWQWQYVGTKPVGSEALRQFERAATIRQAFYNPNSTRLGVEVEVTPVALDAASTGVTMEFGDQSLVWRHDPVKPTTLRWPGSLGRDARIAFQPAVPGAGLSVSGPWALFRLFDAAELQPLSRDSSTATFAMGGREASFTVRSSSVLTPLRLPELRAFRCPEGL